LKHPIEKGGLNDLDYSGEIHAPDGCTQV